jgi:SPP1 family predicted phage head-tail adaptor
MTFAMLLISTFTVYRRLRITDGQGGWAESWEVVLEVTGRLRPLNAAERVVAQQEQARVTHVLYVEAPADIQRGDRVEGEDRVLDVIAVREPSHMGHHLEIDCQETQLEAQAWLS